MLDYNFDKKTYNEKGFSFIYEPCRILKNGDFVTGVSIIEYTSNSSNIELPSGISCGDDEMPVIAIGKKAFLGNKLVKSVLVPASVVEIFDWAFSQCPNLEKVVFLNENIKLGKGIFSECEQIKDICLGYEDVDAQSTLIGAIPCLLKAEYLLSGDDIGTDLWFAKWDNCLTSFLEEDDEEGYTNMILCGEEDIQKSVEGFVLDKRKLKAKLCMLRLMNEHMLKDTAKDKFIGYVLLHMKGCESEESWQLIVDEYNDKIEFFKLLANIGAITEDNIDELIYDMKDYSAETKSYLLSYKQEKFASKDIFASFVL